MIRVDTISKAFGGLRAVDGCSLSIAPGSITGLIGPNGAGKSTLFDIMAGFQRPDSGRVWLGDRDITGLPAHARFHAGVVRTFQVPHEFYRMTVRENLMLVPAGQPGENLLQAWLRWGTCKRRERAIFQKTSEVLAFLQLDGLADELAGNLSGGQKKLLDLGRIMMVEPKLCLLDEPGSGVNPTLMQQITATIRHLNREHGYTFCLVEHDMDLIAQLCDPVIVMAQGTVLTQGTMDEVRANQAVREAYLGYTEAAEA